jgi:hypothetical protein
MRNKTTKEEEEEEEEEEESLGMEILKRMRS